jgi:S-adenosylmethionine decarboxylase
MMRKRPVIEHTIIELFGLDSDILIKFEDIEHLIKKFSEKTKLKIVKGVHHNFSPFGATLVYVLSNSHLAIHTWPENNYLHMDLVTCASIPNPHKLKQIIKDIFSLEEKQIIIKEVKYEN